jgi:hypothetical protein
MGFSTPEPEHPLTVAIWSMDTVNEKLLHWKQLVDERATPLLGYQKEWRYKATLSESSFQIPNLLDPVNPLDKWSKHRRQCNLGSN